jgi:excinuclease ABC subunit C
VGERVFVPTRSQAIVLPESSPELHLLQRIRDEAHRFAITYHKSLRKKKLIQDPLQGIPGVGKARKAALMEHFGHVGRIRDADVDDLSRVKGISRETAMAIYDHLHHEGIQEEKETSATE